MERLPFDIFELLDQPTLTASVAAVAASGGPALGTMWFVFDERRFWFSTRDDGSAFLRAARQNGLIAVMITVFEPPKNIRFVRATGPARIEPHDPIRVQAIYKRYLGSNLDEWPPVFRQRLHDETFELWSVLAAAGRAADYPDFEGSDFRWSEQGTFLDRE